MLRDMTRTIYIREIILAQKEPKICPTCQKEDKLERSIIFENRSNGKTITCTRCEALIVVTNQNIKQVELTGSKDCQIMLKEPHLIRKIDY